MAKKVNDSVLLMGGLVAGAIGSRLISSKVGGLFPASVPPAFANVIPIAGGIFLVKNKNAFLRGAGYGMIAAGGSRFAGELIPAIGSMSTGSNAIRNAGTKYLSLPATNAILSMPASQANLASPYARPMGNNNIVEPRQF